MGTVVDCLGLLEVSKFMSDSISTSQQSTDPNSAPSFSGCCVGLIGMQCFSNYVVDCNLSLWIYLTASKQL